MATTRLRKTFPFPADNSEDEGLPQALDEEEQEKLIAKLRTENEERNDQYTRIFLAIPLTACLGYLPALLTSQSRPAKLVCLLCITSLLQSAYTLLCIPLPLRQKEDLKAKRPMRDLEPEPEQGPINRYMVYSNTVLSLIICLNANALRKKPGVHDGFWLLCFIPGFVLAIITIARRVMLSVDVHELEGLRYTYKGA